MKISSLFCLSLLRRARFEKVPQKTKKITEPENSVIPLVRVAGLEPTAS